MSSNSKVDRGAHTLHRDRKMFQRQNAGIDPLPVPNLQETPNPVQKGDIWYDTEFDDLRAFVGGDILRVGGIAFISLTDSAQIVNTTQRTKFDQAYHWPKDSIDKKRVVRVLLEGDFSTTGSPTLQLRLMANNVLLYDLQAQTVGASVTGDQWYAQFTMVVRNLGASARIATFLDHARFTAALLAGPVTLVDIDPTIDYDITIDAKWSAASPSNKIRVRRFEVFLV